MSRTTDSDTSLFTPIDWDVLYSACKSLTQVRSLRLLHLVRHCSRSVLRGHLTVTSQDYLTIPYQYAVPLLTACTLAHWFISEGIFYVQILPYNIYGKPIPSEVLVTCGVSTIPLEVGLFLMIGVFIVILLLGDRSFKASKMPIAFE